MNLYERIFNILREGLSTGASPTKTGQRVGKFIRSVEKGEATARGEEDDSYRSPEEKLRRTKRRGVRIAKKVADRQGRLHAADSPKYARDIVKDVATEKAYDRFKKNYNIGKQEG